jgi:hypothetical protein
LPPFEASPSLAVTAMMTAVLDLLHQLEESNRITLEHLRRARFLRRPELLIPATRTTVCLAVKSYRLTVSL